MIGIFRAAVLCSACITLALTILASIALAESPPPPVPAVSGAERAEASVHFRRGVDFFQEGIFDAALVEFEQAYAIAPDYRVLYNIGQMHAALGETVAAIRAYEDFLNQGGPWVDPERRSELEMKLPRLRKRTARLSIAVNHAGATVWVDDTEVGTTPLADEILLDIGRHSVVARAENGASASQELTLASGEVRTVTLTLLAAERAAHPAPGEAPHGLQKPVLSRSTKWSIGLLAGAGALAIAGGGAALAARAAHDRHQDALSMQPGDPQAIHKSDEQLVRRSLAADILFGAGLAVGTTGLVLLLTKGRTHTRSSQVGRVDVRWALTPRALVAQGRF